MIIVKNDIPIADENGKTSNPETLVALKIIGYAIANANSPNNGAKTTGLKKVVYDTILPCFPKVKYSFNFGKRADLPPSTNM